MALPTDGRVRVLTAPTVLAKGETYTSFATGPGNEPAMATLTFQADGNLVLYDELKTARWQTHTGSGQGPDPATRCEFQVDGNLVMYDAKGKALWASGTSGHPHALLCVQNDGNVVIYDPFPKALWASNTSHAPRTPAPAPAPAPAPVPRVPSPVPTRVYNFDIESIHCDTTRSGHLSTKIGAHDSVYASLGVKVGATVLPTTKVGIGEMSGGDTITKDVAVMGVRIADNDFVCLQYGVVNDGQGPSQAVALLEQISTKLLTQIQKWDQNAVGDALGGVDLSWMSPDQTNALIGTQIAFQAGAGVAGMAIGGFLGYFASTGWNLLEPDGDGPVAGGLFVTTGANLRKLVPNEGFFRRTDNNPGVDSGAGNGSNSSYQVTWHIHAMD